MNDILYPNDVRDPSVVFYTSVQDFVDKNPGKWVPQAANMAIQLWDAGNRNVTILDRLSGVPIINTKWHGQLNIPGVPTFADYHDWVSQLARTSATQTFWPGSPNSLNDRLQYMFLTSEATSLMNELIAASFQADFAETFQVGISWYGENRRFYTFTVNGKTYDMGYLIALKYAGGVDRPGKWMTSLNGPIYQPQEFINFTNDVAPTPIIVPSGYVPSEVVGAPGTPNVLCLKKVDTSPALTDSQKIDFLYRRAQGQI